MFFCSMVARKIRPWQSTEMEEDKAPTKALYLNTGDKTKSKYSPQKIHSSNEFGSIQFKSCLGLIDSASAKSQSVISGFS